jgi:hypothetical protein
MRKLAESYDFINKPNEAAKYRQILTSLFPASPAARVDEVSTSSAASQAVPPTASVNEESEQK